MEDLRLAFMIVTKLMGELFDVFPLLGVLFWLWVASLTISLLLRVLRAVSRALEAREDGRVADELMRQTQRDYDRIMYESDLLRWFGVEPPHHEIIDQMRLSLAEEIDPRYYDPDYRNPNYHRERTQGGER